MFKGCENHGYAFSVKNITVKTGIGGRLRKATYLCCSLTQNNLKGRHEFVFPSGLNIRVE